MQRPVFTLRLNPAEHLIQTSQSTHCEQPETQGKHLSCCSSQKVPRGQDGTFPMLSGLVGLFGLLGLFGLVISTHFKVLISHCCEDVQAKHIFPL